MCLSLYFSRLCGILRGSRAFPYSYISLKDKAHAHQQGKTATLCLVICIIYCGISFVHSWHFGLEVPDHSSWTVTSCWCFVQNEFYLHYSGATYIVFFLFVFLGIIIWWSFFEISCSGPTGYMTDQLNNNCQSNPSSINYSC